jgi:hypothetical protein
MRARVPLGERGIALITALLLSMVMSAVILGIVMLSLNATLIGKQTERIAIVDDAAVAGLEEGRSRLNGNRSLYLTSGYSTLESGAAVKDASGATIPGVTRSVYAAATGITSGQFGVIGSIIAVAQDRFGTKSIRRLDVNQESFSKFSYFTNSENDTLNSNVVFGGGDQLRGPVHSNDRIEINNSGSTPQATFFDQVTSAASSILNQSRAQFNLPPRLSVPRIAMPTVADLNRLDSLAQIGGTRFTGSTLGGAGEARTRVQFITIDLGPTDGGVQGFFRVYYAGAAIANPERYVSASLPGSGPSAKYLELSHNCGDVTNGKFLAAFYHSNAALPANYPGHRHARTTENQTNWTARADSSLIPGGKNTGNPAVDTLNPIRPSGAVRCYLGGDSILTYPDAGATWLTTGHLDGGQWVQAPAAVQTALAGLANIASRRDKQYLFPLNRSYNPLFKGVIYVAGKVIVDGQIHGRVTVAASGNIIFGNDVTYFQNPATRDCATGDIAGYFSGQSLIVSNNTINAPQTLNDNGSQSSSGLPFRTYDDSPDETIHGFFLTLRTFGAENNGAGSTNAEQCTIGGTFNAGRGCLNTYGGIIQANRGAVGTTGGTGYIKRYQYDACGATNPPPYYPTTGVFVKNRFYTLDPTRFNVANWYTANQH